jgi:GNAT superfamily N-acetyltransferase
MPYSIRLELNPKPEDIQIIGNGIMQFAKQRTKHKPMEFFAVFVRDSNQTILGGCNGSTLYGCLYIDQLWVDESLRHKGYGRQLIEKALAFGIDKECSFATVNTMNWEALEFYQKLGFVIEFQRTGFDHNSIFYFLRKPLAVHSSETTRLSENTAFPWKKDKLLCDIVDELKNIHQCHTILLYGSRARGDFTPSSDYDIAGISSSLSEKLWLARFDENHQVFCDVFVYPENELLHPNESHLQMSDGVILIEKNHFGTEVLNKLKAIQHTSPVLTDNELQGRKVWYRKMLARAKVGDLKGKYRQIWMIYTILEDYFAFKQLRYEGPKKAFQYLTKHDPGVLSLFEKVLADANDIHALEILIQNILTNKCTGIHDI